MRFMVLIKSDAKIEAGALPSKELIVAMGQFNEEMVKAGVLLGGEGLHPSSRGARLRYSGKGDVGVIDGPFAETKELIAGYWLIEVPSLADAIAWMKRCPTTPDGGEIEIRQIFDASDFPTDVFPPEEQAKEQAMRDEIERRKR